MLSFSCSRTRLASICARRFSSNSFNLYPDQTAGPASSERDSAKDSNFQVRQEYENAIKLAAQSLSRATSAGDLVKLLKATTFLDR